MLVEVRCLGWGREGCALEADWEECMQAPLVAQRAGSARKLLVGLRPYRRRATALCEIRPGRWSETSRCRKLTAHLNHSRDDPSQSQGLCVRCFAGNESIMDRVRARKWV